MTTDTLVYARAAVPSESRWTAWGASLGLVLLSVIPTLAGSMRLASFATGSALMPDGPRFAAHPAALVTHIIAALTYSLLGAMQFSTSLRRRSRALHRAAGWLSAPAGIITAGAGLWCMAQYAAASTAGLALHAMRVMAAVAIIAFIMVALFALQRRDYRAHGAWMTRAYAIGIGAGTQALVLAPLTFVIRIDTKLSYALGMALGWTINVVVAEVIIRRRTRSLAR